MSEPGSQTSARHSTSEAEKPSFERSGLPRALLAEFVGTFALVFVAAGGDVIAKVSHGQITPAARAIAPGLLVMALIYTLGKTSGAHFNPAVTFAFAVRRNFPWKHVPLYWAAQVVAAVAAALFLRALFGLVADLGATRPHFGDGASFFMEIALTWLLLTVILGTATQTDIVGHEAALAVGATIALCGLFALPVSGASMNPARSLGPALASGALSHVWIYLTAPFLGAGLASALMYILHPGHGSKEREAAQGQS